MSLYYARDLTRIHGRRTVLAIDSLDIESGRIHGLLGANGAGKTTLLNILAFLDVPTAGHLGFDGRPVRFSGSHLRRLRRQVVLVDQHPVAFSTTVAGNIEFGLKIRRIGRRQRVRIIDEVLALVGLEGFRNASARGLSGGETQRLAMARALAVTPKVLLCDEPTSSVDVENQAAIVDILRRINRERGISIIFTTHDRQLAAGLADRILYLDHGRLVATGWENVFSCTVEGHDERHDRCLLPGGRRLLLPRGLAPAPGISRLSIDPRAVQLAPPARETEAEQGLRGRVVLLTAEGEQVRMVVDAGIRITLFIDPARYRTLRPGIGDEVALAVQPQGICFLAGR